jgi:hypothetical protein
MKHLVLSRADKAMERLVSSVRKDVNETVVGYFAPVTSVVRSVGKALAGSSAKAVSKQGRYIAKRPR